MKSISDLTYKENLLLDLHLPESGEFDLFAYFHGGGLSPGKRGGVSPREESTRIRGLAPKGARP